MLSLEQCAHVDKGEVERILAVELQSIAAGREDVPSSATAVSVLCDKGNNRITLSNAAGGIRTLERDNTHHLNAQKGVERLIAIAAAELVFSGWVKLKKKQEKNAKNVSPQVSVQKHSPAAPRKDEVSTATESDPAVLLGLSPSWRLFFDGGLSVFGGELTVELDLRGPLILGIGVELEGGSATRDLAKISFLGVSGLYLMGVGQKVGRYLAARAALGMRIGYGRLKGSARVANAEDHDLAGGWGGPLLRLELHTRDRLFAGLAVEGGYAVWGNTGYIGSEDPVNLKKWWLAILVRVSLCFGNRNRA
jgi:hypothetical protein